MAALFGLMAVALWIPFRGERAINVPVLASLPIVIVTGIIVQFALGRLPFPQIGLLYSAYLLWAGMLCWLGRDLSNSLGLPKIADVLAAAVLFGATLSTGIAIAKWLGLAAGVSWVLNSNDSSIYGNIGQPNQFAHYSWLGIASAFYFAGRGRISRLFLWLIVLPIALGSVVSGSRSVFIYPLLILAMMWWSLRSDDDTRVRSCLLDAAILLPVVFILSYLAGLVPVPGANSASSLFEKVAGPSVRISLIQTAWSGFLENFWFGQGAGSFTWASFNVASNSDIDAPIKVAEHAHNLILNLLTEFGVFVTIAVISVIAFWALRFFSQKWTQAHFWCGSVLAIGAVHSMLEYPLWYTYFLGPTALLLGATDSGKLLALQGRRVLAYVGLALVGGGIILFNLRADYAVIETAIYRPFTLNADREQSWAMTKDRLLVLQRESLLSPWAMLAFSILAEPAREQVAERVVLCERGIRFSPARLLITRCAVQLAIAGREADAFRLADAVWRAFPAERDATRKEITTAAREFPEVMPLLARLPHVTAYPSP